MIKSRLFLPLFAFGAALLLSTLFVIILLFVEMESVSEYASGATYARQKWYIVRTSLLPAGVTLLAGFLGFWLAGAAYARRKIPFPTMPEPDALLDPSVNVAHFNELLRRNNSYSWVADRNGLLLDVSPSIEAVLGYTPDEMIRKMYLYDIYPETVAAAYRENLEHELLDSTRLGHTHPAFTKDHKSIWLARTVSAIRDAHGNVIGYLGSSSADTEYHTVSNNTDEELRISRLAVRHYAAFLAAASEGAWEYNIATQKIWISPTTIRMFGLDAQGDERTLTSITSPQWWVSRVHPEDITQVEQTTRTYLANPLGRVQQTFRILHGDGTWHWYCVRGTLVEDTTESDRLTIVGTIIDTTGTNQVHDLLSQDDEKTRILTEDMRDVIWIGDVDSLRLTYINAAILPVLGYTPTEVIGQPLQSLMPPDQSDRLMRQIHQHSQDFKNGIAYPNNFNTYHLDMPRKDGSFLPVEMIVHYWKNVQTGKLEIHGLARDLSGRRLLDSYHTLNTTVLRLLNEPHSIIETLNRLVGQFQKLPGVNAAGIRLQDGDTFPFVAHTGYPCDFQEKEDDLRIMDENGQPIRNAEGQIMLRCACGRVLTGDTAGAEPFFTPNGSCWTNHAQVDFAPPADGESPVPTCLSTGFASIALVPISARGKIIGLIQLTSNQQNTFSMGAILMLETVAAHIGEATLRKQVERDYHALFQHMVEGFAIFEEAGTEEALDFRILANNKAFCVIRGLDTEKDLTGTLVSEFLPEEGFQHLIEAYKGLRQSTDGVFASTFTSTTGKKLAYTLYVVSPKQFAIILNDLTDHTRADSDLQETRHQYMTLLKNLPGMAFRINLHDDGMAFEYASDAAESLFGYTPDELLSGNIDPMDMVMPIHQEAYLQELQDAIAGHRQFSLEYEARAKDGSPKWVLEQTQIIYDAEDKPIAYEGFVSDVTSRKFFERYHELGLETLQIVNSTDNIQAMLQTLVEKLRTATGVEAVGIRLKGGSAFPYAATTGFSDEFLFLESKFCSYCGDDGKPVMGPDGGFNMHCACGSALSDRDIPGAEQTPARSYWSNRITDIFDLRPELRASSACMSSGYQSMALIPIRSHGEAIGLIQFLDHRQNQFSKEMILLLESLSGQIGEAIQRNRAEQDFRTLFKEMTEGFAMHEAILDTDGKPSDYRFLSINPAAEIILGTKNEAIVGKSIKDVVAKGYAFWEEKYQEVAQTKQPVQAQRMAPDQGRDFEYTFIQLSSTHFACIFSDITDRLKAENAIKESQRRFQTLISNLSGMVFTARCDEQRTMTFVSEGAEKLTGYAPFELLENKKVAYPEIIAPECRNLFKSEMEKVLTRGDGTKLHLEYEILTKSGERKWVWEQSEALLDETGMPISVEGFVTDITQRKAAEESLRESSRIYRTLTSNMKDVVWVFDLALDQFIFITPSIKQLRDYTPDEYLALSKEDAFAGIPEAIIADLYLKANLFAQEDNNQEEAIFYTFSSPQIRKDGSEVFVEVVYRFFRNEKNGHLEVHAVSRDITERRDAEMEKDRIQSQLLQSNKMESIGRLAGSVAHDFNNMLQAILGYTEMALEQVDKDQPLYSDVDAIQKAAHRAAELTKQLLIFSRKQSSSLQVIDINKSIHNMVGILRRLIGASIQFSWQLVDAPFYTKADPNQLDHLLANICINARDAIESPSGTIKLSTQEVNLTEPLLLATGLLATGQYAIISVADSGKGMSQEVMTQIFEPFFTTKRKDKGTGLGLSTVYGIMKQLGGGIGVKSKEGVGTTFSLYFPSSPPPQDEAAAISGITAETLPTGTEKVLLVDDEEAIAQAAKRMLESLGYKVIATTDPEAALKIALDPAEAIEAVLSDVIMPQMNGPTLMQKITQVHPNLPYLFMSGYTGNLLAEHGLEKDKIDFIVKPFNRAILAKRIRETIDKKKQQS